MMMVTFLSNFKQGKGETLLFSFLGMKTSSYFVNCRKNVSNITVTLSDDNHLLDEVVVATGYQDYFQRKGLLVLFVQ